MSVLGILFEMYIANFHPVGQYCHFSTVGIFDYYYWQGRIGFLTNC